MAATGGQQHHATITASPVGLQHQQHQRPPSAILQAAGATATITPTRPLPPPPPPPPANGSTVVQIPNTTAAINLSSGVTVTPTSARPVATVTGAEQIPSVTVSLTAATGGQKDQPLPLNLKQQSAPPPPPPPPAPTAPSVTVIPSPRPPFPAPPASVVAHPTPPVALSLVMNKSNTVEVRTVINDNSDGMPEVKKARMEENGAPAAT